MRILVIEDERTLAGFVEQSLRAEGYAVTVAHDGESGQARALTGDYALVLLDLTLPGRDGLEVLKAIRARLPDMPVIVLTARAAIEQRVEGLDLGANDYVTKPFSFAELTARARASAVTRASERRRRWRPASFAWISGRGGSLATGTRSS
jgi:DNA-binding response OmpR family regulator